MKSDFKKSCFFKKIFSFFGLAIMFFLPAAVSAFIPTHKFTDQLQDTETELYYYGNRYYNPEIGKFTQPDPLQNYLVTPELEDRSGMTLEEILANPQRLNSYSYSLNNPINVTDPTGEVSQKRQERFDSVSDYIRNDDSYWLIRDRDGNAKALDAIWNKCLELSKDEEGNTNIGDALDTFYDAVHIDWAGGNTLDSSLDDFENRLTNLPNALGGQYGSDRSNIDKLQHFAASARLAYKYGPRIAMLLGKLKEVKDGIHDFFKFGKNGYSELSHAGVAGYSVGDLAANEAGIFWITQNQDNGTKPSQVINNYY